MLTSGEDVYIRTEMLAWRSLFLSGLKEKLTSSWESLAALRWRVLRAPAGISFLTSDDPVVKLQPSGELLGFGGWKLPGCTIFMPLRPNCLVYTEAGVRPMQDALLSAGQAQSVNNLTAIHAYRAIYAPRPLAHIGRLRSRVVNVVRHKQEGEEVQAFHDAQTAAEWELLTHPVTDLPEAK